MSELEKIYVLDDGSWVSKLLIKEYEGKYDVETVNVPDTDIVTQFEKVKNDGKKIHLALCYDSLVANHEKKRKEVDKVRLLGFNNLIVLPYEGHDERTLLFKAVEKGIITAEERDKILNPELQVATGEGSELDPFDKDENYKPYTTVTTRNGSDSTRIRKVSDLSEKTD